MKLLNCLVSSLIIELFISCAPHRFQSDPRAARDKEKGNFVVTTDGTTIKGDQIRQRYPLLRRPYAEIDRGERVKLNEISVLQDDKGYYQRVDRLGLLPRIKKGNINTFLHYEVRETYNAPGVGMGSMGRGGWSRSVTPVYYIQKSDSGSVMKMTPDRLNEMVVNYQPALDYMNTYYSTRKKTRIWNLINTAALIGGMALAGSAIGSEGDIKPIGYLGVGLTVGGLGNGFVNKYRKANNDRNLELAIDEYNRKRR